MPSLSVIVSLSIGAACRLQRIASDVARRAFASQHLSVCLRFATCVCLSACDSQRQAHSSERCNNAMLIYDRVVELLLRSGCLAVCLRFGSTRRAFTTHHVSVCLRLGWTRAFDSQRLSICLRLGSRALVDA